MSRQEYDNVKTKYDHVKNKLEFLEASVSQLAPIYEWFQHLQMTLHPVRILLELFGDKMALTSMMPIQRMPPMPSHPFRRASPAQALDNPLPPIPSLSSPAPTSITPWAHDSTLLVHGILGTAGVTPSSRATEHKLGRLPEVSSSSSLSEPCLQESSPASSPSPEPCLRESSPSSSSLPDPCVQDSSRRVTLSLAAITKPVA